ncbi:hypothetical protein Scep_022446 [Stephania cephalantha]|uniref:Uncharacterized protein n=1 Tax=Stephania cephalantha TaxID=152367 RepID=A0AAP0FB38_9MAGN
MSVLEIQIRCNDVHGIMALGSRGHEDMHIAGKEVGIERTTSRQCCNSSGDVSISYC